ncbi:ATP-grasp domain-containing protein [Pseudomonas saliphila]|uniref:circularly permuted type 2 ATP-grasp protein n=1 Tax=Pseudomonas saliphila TaxID=2586906 RepID=UPI00123A94CA|nr:circularly permuted type 2 ATP-grasp protein [Pseudomonas saliphila]
MTLSHLTKDILLHPTHDSPAQTIAKSLNQHCACATLDRPAVLRNVANQLGDSAEDVLSSPAWNQFFSNTAVFVPSEDLDRMMATVRALEAAAALPDYQRRVLSRASQSAQVNPGPVGAFMGYDFHLGEQSPSLIEVNTNAGGAFLNAELARAQLQCCGGRTRMAWAEDFDAAVIAQFESEWRSQRGSGQPESIAIIDDQPTEQYLYPEFRLAQKLFRDNGIDARIVSPSDLRYESGALYSHDKRIDMVYNRLVDFALEAPEHAALRSAWLDGGAVITPNPFSHALFADKRNLAEWSAPSTLQDWGLNAESIELLRGSVPRTVLVTASNAAELWQQRREWFFKPVAGYGSKGAYRGSKLTKGTFAQIVQSEYIAQAYVPPSERLVLVDGERKMLKVDVRLYTYRGNLILAAARLYQGQTTNFRTPGGGFAPVFIE